MLFLNVKKFISVTTGVDVGVSHDLESYTSEIGLIKMPFPGRNIVFVDTPGFDNTMRSDGDILKVISDWLQITYVVPERTEVTADRRTKLGLRERLYLVAFFVSTRCQAVRSLGPISRSSAYSSSSPGKMPPRMLSSPPLCGTK